MTPACPRCAQCGSVQSGAMPFCVECGGALPPTPDETMRTVGVGMTVIMSVLCLLLAALLAVMLG